VLEGVGTALLIPPVYILTTLRFSDLTSRARACGPGGAALPGPVQAPHIEPRAGDAEHPVAAADGHVIRRRRVPPDGPRLRRDRDRVIFTAATVGVLVSSLAAERSPNDARSGR
jgi:hypothetical protein